MVREQRVILQDVARTRSDEVFYTGESVQMIMCKALQYFCAHYRLEYMQGLNEVLAPLLAINIVAAGHYSAVSNTLSAVCSPGTSSLSVLNAVDDLEGEFTGIDHEIIAPEEDDFLEPYELKYHEAAAALEAAAERASNNNLSDCELKGALLALADAQIEQEYREAQLRTEQSFQRTIAQYNVSFVVFERLLLSMCPSLFSPSGIIALQSQLACFHTLLYYVDAPLANYLNGQGMRCDIYAQGWLITLFARRTSVELVLYAWDHLLQRDYLMQPHKLLSLCVAFLVHHRQALYRVHVDELPQLLVKLRFSSETEIDEVFNFADNVHRNTPAAQLRDSRLSGFTTCVPPLREALLKDLMSRPCALSHTAELAAHLMDAAAEKKDGYEELLVQMQNATTTAQPSYMVANSALDISTLPVAKVIEVISPPASSTQVSIDKTSIEDQKIESATTSVSSTGWSLVNGVWNRVEATITAVDAVLPDDDTIVKSVSEFNKELGQSLTSLLSRIPVLSNPLAPTIASAQAPTRPSEVAANRTESDPDKKTGIDVSRNANNIISTPVQKQLSIVEAMSRSPRLVVLDCRQSDACRRMGLLLEGALPVGPEAIADICRTATARQLAGRGEVIIPQIRDSSRLIYEFLVFCANVGGVHFVLVDDEGENFPNDQNNANEKSLSFAQHLSERGNAMNTMSPKQQLAAAMLVLGFSRVSILQNLEAILPENEQEKHQELAKEVQEELANDREKAFLMLPSNVGTTERLHEQLRSGAAFGGFLSLVVELLAKRGAEIKPMTTINKYDTRGTNLIHAAVSASYVAPTKSFASEAEIPQMYYIATKQTSLVVDKVNIARKIIDAIEEKEAIARIKTESDVKSTIPSVTPLSGAPELLKWGDLLDGAVSSINSLGALTDIPNIRQLFTFSRMENTSETPKSAMETNSGAADACTPAPSHDFDAPRYSSAALKEQQMKQAPVNRPENVVCTNDAQKVMPDIARSNVDSTTPPLRAFNAISDVAKNSVFSPVANMSLSTDTSPNPIRTLNTADPDSAVRLKKFLVLSEAKRSPSLANNKIELRAILSGLEIVKGNLEEIARKSRDCGHKLDIHFQRRHLSKAPQQAPFSFKDEDLL